MKLDRLVLTVLVLGAWTVSFAQADARQRNAKHAANTARHAGQHSATGGTAGHGKGSRDSSEINPDMIFVPPVKRSAKQAVGRPGVTKRAALGPASPNDSRRKASVSAASRGKNAIGAAPQPPAAGPPVTGAGASPGANTFGAKANAIGAHASIGGSTPSEPAGRGKLGPGNPPNGVPATIPAQAVQAYGGTISGTGIKHPGVAPGTLGGPNKVATGLGGTGFKPKR